MVTRITGLSMVPTTDEGAMRPFHGGLGKFGFVGRSSKGSSRGIFVRLSMDSDSMRELEERITRLKSLECSLRIST
jgi:hypothetical protein